MEKKYPIGGYAPGNYICNCATCGRGFNGDKRAVQCEPCAVADKEKFDTLSPAEQEGLMKSNAEAIKDMFSKWNIAPNTSSHQDIIFKVCKKHGVKSLELTTKHIALISDCISEYIAQQAGLPPIDDYPKTPEMDLILRIVAQWGNAIEMPNMEGWLKEYAKRQPAQPPLPEPAAPQGPVWVKAAYKLPCSYELLHLRVGKKKLTGSWDLQKEYFIDLNDNLYEPNDVEWLDEQAVPSNEREGAFAEWASENGYSFDKTTGWMDEKYGVFTTAQLWEIWQKEKGK